MEILDDLIERPSGQPEMYMCAVCGAIIDENYACEHIKELIPYIQELKG